MRVWIFYPWCTRASERSCQFAFELVVSGFFSALTNLLAISEGRPAAQPAASFYISLLVFFNACDFVLLGKYWWPFEAASVAPDDPGASEC